MNLISMLECFFIFPGLASEFGMTKVNEADPLMGIKTIHLPVFPQLPSFPSSHLLTFPPSHPFTLSTSTPPQPCCHLSTKLLHSLSSSSSSLSFSPSSYPHLLPRPHPILSSHHYQASIKWPPRALSQWAIAGELVLDLPGGRR